MRQVTLPIEDIFSDEYDGHLISEESNCKTFPNGDTACLSAFGELALLAKKRTSPDIYSERQMKGPEWNEPKHIVINKLKPSLRPPPDQVGCGRPA